MRFGARVNTDNKRNEFKWLYYKLEYTKLTNKEY